MARKPLLSSMNSVMGSSNPYGMSSEGKAAQVALAQIRLDPGQPRRLLPADIVEQLHAGKLTLVDAMRQWAAQTNTPVNTELDHESNGSSSAMRLGKVRELAISILNIGLIQPVNVIKQDDGYVIETGERRVLAHAWLVACGNSQFEKVQVLFVGTAAEHRLRQVAENLSREDLSAVEKARSLWNIRYELSQLPTPDWMALRTASNLNIMLDRNGLVTWEQVAKAVGLGKRQRIRLTNTFALCAEAIQLIELHSLPERKVRPLIDFLIDDADGQVSLLRRALASTVDESDADNTRDAEEADSGIWSSSLFEAEVRRYVSERDGVITPDATVDSIADTHVEVNSYSRRLPNTAASAAVAATEAVAFATRQNATLKARRAFQTLHRNLQNSLGDQDLSAETAPDLARELSTQDPNMSALARRIKPLVDALAELPQIVRTESVKQKKK